MGTPRVSQSTGKMRATQRQGEAGGGFMRSLTIGKYRGLQQCATPRGAFAILALDHRNNLRNALNPTNPKAVLDADLTHFKQEVVVALAPAASAVLLDPQFGAAQCIAAGALPGGIGLLVACEETGYTGDPMARKATLLPGWSVAKARRMGASAVKILVYYHPDARTAGEIEDFVRMVAADCATNDLPLFIEPLSYPLDPSKKSVEGAERRRVVIETARRLVPMGADVLKAEFPVDIRAEPDERHWAEACAELSEAAGIPWVLLSASVNFETYLRQGVIACQSGASGVAVGRAVWQEAVTQQGEQRLSFLRSVARPRMERLTDLCAALARPWTEIYAAPNAGEGWMGAYP